MTRRHSILDNMPHVPTAAQDQAWAIANSSYYAHSSDEADRRMKAAKGVLVEELFAVAKQIMDDLDRQNEMIDAVLAAERELK
jgi:hypothetical protein